ncbi:GNAT family N-acetyltransferase [Chitinimonas sp. BJYL2]|uniref:GNAT family N-acetyltransferase n=1 Tax=Chitinimonas sp. BJYL2 TaxID=2976696 RepID=UPI0022B379DA|nr:GNAT family N-acetyltransferase [Chitinimonas sp. BJYL2]
MIIRFATEADAPVLAALAQAVWVDSYAREGMRAVLADYVRDAFTAERYLRELADPARQIWVAERDGHLLGYASLNMETSPIRPELNRRLETLYVLRRLQGQGVGRALMQAVAVASPQGWLSTWHRNEEALAFYARIGCQRIGETAFELEGESHLNHVLAWGIPA